MAQGYSQELDDPDDSFASTPQLLSLKVLLLFALAKNYKIIIGDVQTAFLHAELPKDDKPIYVRPPKEYYGGLSKLWKLRRPLYGLRTAPKHWQDHFADVLEKLGARRLKSEANVYFFKSTLHYVLVYVDDVMIIGTNPQTIFDSIAKSYY